jgi:hypothetical protein
MMSRFAFLFYAPFFSLFCCYILYKILRARTAGGPPSHDATAILSPGIVEGADVRIKKVIEWGIGPHPPNDIKFTFENSWTSDFELGDGEHRDFKLDPGSYDITELTGGWTLDRVQILGEDPITLSGPTVEFIGYLRFSIGYGRRISTLK